MRVWLIFPCRCKMHMRFSWYDLIVFWNSMIHFSVTIWICLCRCHANILEQSIHILLRECENQGVGQSSKTLFHMLWLWNYFIPHTSCKSCLLTAQLSSPALSPASTIFSIYFKTQYFLTEGNSSGNFSYFFLEHYKHVCNLNSRVEVNKPHRKGNKNFKTTRCGTVLTR